MRHSPTVRHMSEKCKFLVLFLQTTRTDYLHSGVRGRGEGGRSIERRMFGGVMDVCYAALRYYVVHFSSRRVLHYCNHVRIQL